MICCNRLGPSQLAETFKRNAKEAEGRIEDIQEVRAEGSKSYPIAADCLTILFSSAEGEEKGF